jgi:hypothetical protein
MTPEEEAIIQQLIQYGMTPEEAFYYAAQQGLIFPEMGMADASTDGSDTMGGEMGVGNPAQMGMANQPVLGPNRSQAFADPMGEQMATASASPIGSGWPHAVGGGGLAGQLTAALAMNGVGPGGDRPPGNVTIQDPGRLPHAWGMPDFGGSMPGSLTSGRQITQNAPIQNDGPYNRKGDPGYVPGRSGVAASNRNDTSGAQATGDRTRMPQKAERSEVRGKPPVSGDFKNYGQQRKAEVHARNDERKAARPTVAGSRPNPSPAQKAAPRVAAARAGARPATSGLPAGMKPPRAQPGSVPPPARASGAPTRTPYSQKPQTKIGGMLTKISRPSSTGFSGRR